MNGWQSVRKTRLFRVIAICLVLFVLISWNPRRLLYPVRVAFDFIAEPFEKIFSVLGFYTSSSSEFLSSIGSLKQENERLTHENVRLTAESAKLSDMRNENESLRRELDLLPRETFRLKAAEVIGRDQQSAGNWLLIGKGSADGIEKGMVAIVDQSAVVGRVSDVSPQSAKIVLLTSPESVINGIDAQTEARGIVRGQYGSGMLMDTVLQADILKQGDAIVTSGLGGDFPKGLFLGKIDSAHPSDDRLFQQATLVPLVNFSKLRTVFIITGSGL